MKRYSHALLLASLGALALYSPRDSGQAPQRVFKQTGSGSLPRGRARSRVVSSSRPQARWFGVEAATRAPLPLAPPRYDAVTTPRVLLRPIASHFVALSRRASSCAAPSEPMDTVGVCVSIRGLRFGAPDTIRTYDLGFRKALLYPAELRERRAELVTVGADAQGLGYLRRFFDSVVDLTGFLSRVDSAWPWPWLSPGP